LFPFCNQIGDIGFQARHVFLTQVQHLVLHSVIKYTHTAAFGNGGM
jgi:hypothetical protein